MGPEARPRPQPCRPLPKARGARATGSLFAGHVVARSSHLPTGDQQSHCGPHPSVTAQQLGFTLGRRPVHTCGQQGHMGPPQPADSLQSPRGTSSCSTREHWEGCRQGPSPGSDQDSHAQPRCRPAATVPAGVCHRSSPASISSHRGPGREGAFFRAAQHERRSWAHPAELIPGRFHDLKVGPGPAPGSHPACQRRLPRLLAARTPWNPWPLAPGDPQSRDLEGRRQGWVCTSMLCAGWSAWPRRASFLLGPQLGACSHELQGLKPNPISFYPGTLGLSKPQMPHL